MIVADVLADNGVVRVIDAVLLPPATDVVTEADVTWTMMPNPATDVVTLSGIPAEASVRVFDLTGREVRQITPGQRVVTVSDLTSGTYLVMVKHGANVRTEKLIVR